VQGAVLALWSQGKGAFKLPGLGCPVVTIHEVALEDLVDELLPAAFGHLRAAYEATSEDAQQWLTQHLAGQPPDIREAFVRHHRALMVTEKDWVRRGRGICERVASTILVADGTKPEWKSYNLRRWLRDTWRIDRVDLRLASCEQCGKDYFRRRSEPNAPPLCEMCREARRLHAWHLALSPWRSGAVTR
jgi:hypothetical protein